MRFLEIVQYCLLGAAVVLLIIGFIFEKYVVAAEKALWRSFKRWLVAKLRASRRFMNWLYEPPKHGIPDDEWRIGQIKVFGDAWIS